MSDSRQYQKEVYIGKYGLVKKHEKFGSQVLEPNGRHFAYIADAEVARRMVDKPLKNK